MKQSLAIILALFFCFMIVPSVQAIGLDYYRMELDISEDTSVGNIIAIKFDTPITHLDYQFDFNIYDLNVSANFDLATCETINHGRYSDVSCDFVGLTKEKNLFIMNFRTKNSVSRVDNKFQFNMNYPVSLPIKKAYIIIKLPENGVLAGEDVNESYSPEGAKILSDGKKILLYWEWNGLEAGETMQFSVLYDMPLTGGPLFNVIIVSLTMIIIFVMVGITFYIKKSTTKTAKNTEEIVSSVLNEDEKKVVEIIKEHGGETIQRNIVSETDFSKAKVSRIVKNLKDRNVLEVIPMGRKNKIKIVIELEKELGKEEE
jgi:uncharacterized membrane protein